MSVVSPEGCCGPVIEISIHVDKFIMQVPECYSSLLDSSSIHAKADADAEDWQFLFKFMELKRFIVKDKGVRDEILNNMTLKQEVKVNKANRKRPLQNHKSDNKNTKRPNRAPNEISSVVNNMDDDENDHILDHEILTMGVNSTKTENCDERNNELPRRGGSDDNSLCSTVFEGSRICDDNRSDPVIDGDRFQKEKSVQMSSECASAPSNTLNDVEGADDCRNTSIGVKKQQKKPRIRASNTKGSRATPKVDKLVTDTLDQDKKSASFVTGSEILEIINEGQQNEATVMQITLADEGPLGFTVGQLPPSNSAVVTKVADNSQAARAGLRPNDFLCLGLSSGQTEMPFEVFLQLSKQRPVRFEIRREKEIIISENDDDSDEECTEDEQEELEEEQQEKEEAFLGKKKIDVKKETIEYTPKSTWNRNQKWNKQLWISRLLELKEFNEKHGNYNVPGNKPEFKGLFQWLCRVKHQGRALLRGKDIDDFKEKFNMINELEGWSWESRCREYDWDEHFELLVAFKEKYGHANVPKGDTEFGDLAKWAHLQRIHGKRFREGKESSILTEERRQKMDAIGFRWNIFDTTWETNYEKLKQYKKEHGNCLVPRRYAKDPKFGNWVYDTRRKGRKLRAQGKTTVALTNERFKILDELGFCWRCK